MNNIKSKLGLFLLLMVTGIFFYWLPSLYFGHPAEVRDFPVYQLWFWEIVSATIFAVVLVAVFIPQSQCWFVNKLGYWIGSGGFWKVWSRENTPGNTWLIIALFLGINALISGQPTNLQFDKEEIVYSAQTLVSNPKVEPVKDFFKGVVNIGSQMINGQKILVVEKNVEPEIKKPLPRYERGWWPKIIFVFVLIFAILVFIWGRRDELVEHVENFVGHLTSRLARKKPDSDSGSSQQGVVARAGSTVAQSLLGHGRRIFDDVLGEFFAKWLSRFAVLMRKF